MNENFESQQIDLNQISIDSINQSLDFTLEVEGRIKNDKLECYLNNINSHYCKYLNVERSEIIGNNIFSINDDFVNIYYQIMNYLFRNSMEDSVNIYIKKSGKKLEILSIEDIEEENCESYQIMAYAFRKDTQFLKVFIVIKDICKELRNMQEKSSIRDINNYNDKIMSMSDIVSNLSHAWRQPLNSLNFSIINLIDEIDNEAGENGLVNEYYNEIWQIIKNLSRKIDKFKAFFEMDYKKEIFYIKKYLDLVFEIMEEKIRKEHIKIDISIEENIKKYGSPNEFVQIMYCIFFDIIEYCKNALDIYNRKLKIQIYVNERDIFFDIKVVYDTEIYNNFKLSLNHISMFSSIIHKTMGGTINLINCGIENRVIISFPLDI
ncbi:hypothetical protein [Brassicibacter mesophilus]|uniref:hypothetical protein n=1 Tax=Brassicibacter mesophilus TaxID=745119 RepID=UPI003D19E1EC